MRQARTTIGRAFQSINGVLIALKIGSALKAMRREMVGSVRGVSNLLSNASINSDSGRVGAAVVLIPP
jgi:hypothetical protein